MALRDKFLQETPVSEEMMVETPAGEAEMEAKMNEADAAFDDAMATGS